MEAFGRVQVEDFKLELELGNGKTIDIPVLSSQLFMIMNGKFGGSHLPFTPMAMMNDGLLDLLFLRGKFSNTFS